MLNWPKAYRCAKCLSKIKIDAYYCKKCSALVDLSVAPNSRIPDRSLTSFLARLWNQNPLTKFLWLIAILIILVSGTTYGFHLYNAAKDNNSSKIFRLNVDNASSPFTCHLGLCQVTVSLVNKSKDLEKITGIGYFEDESGKEYLSSDAKPQNWINDFPIYCHPKIMISLKPKEKVDFYGLCFPSPAPGVVITKVGIKDLSGKVLVTGNMGISIPAY